MDSARDSKDNTGWDRNNAIVLPNHSFVPSHAKELRERSIDSTIRRHGDRSRAYSLFLGEFQTFYIRDSFKFPCISLSVILILETLES